MKLPERTAPIALTKNLMKVPFFCITQRAWKHLLRKASFNFFKQIVLDSAAIKFNDAIMKFVPEQLAAIQIQNSKC